MMAVPQEMNEGIRTISDNEHTVNDTPSGDSSLYDSDITNKHNTNSASSSIINPTEKGMQLDSHYNDNDNDGDKKPTITELDTKHKMDGERKPRFWENKSYEHMPVDQGFAWAVVASGFFMLMFAMGCVNCYGAYQAYYSEHQFPNEPKSTLSWIGTIQFAGLNVFGIPAGILAERYDPRIVTFTGGIIMGVAYIIASFCDGAVWKLIITQGIVFSIGGSLVFIPSMSIPSQWFKKHRALAVGLVVSGSGVGGLWLTPATKSMIDSLGTAWALRITGIIILVVNSTASLFMRNRLSIRSREKVVDFGLLKDIRFAFVFCGAICATTGYFTPFFNAPGFAVVKIGKSESFATNLVTIINAASTVGRVGTGQIAPMLGNINTLFICTLISGLSIFIFWLPFESTGTMIAFSVIYGIFCGGFISLLPVIMAALWGVSRISTIIGLLYIANFIGTMVGSPSSNAILDNVGHGSNFKPSIGFSGAFMIASAFFFFCLRLTTKASWKTKI